MKLQELLFKNVRSESLGLFRILVGFSFLLQAFHFLGTDFIQENFVDSKLRVPFYCFEWLEPFSPSGLKFVLLILLISAFLIAIGKYTRIAATLYFLGFTYLWLLDKSYFNNHYYFISLLAFLIAITRSDSWGSVDKKKRSEYVENWQVLIFKFQLFVVFFIAGINKINYYWLVEFQPMKVILETKADLDGDDWLSTPFFYGFFSILGMLFDLSIGFLIWAKKTRRFGIIIYVLFNLMNFWIFKDIGEIGIFPFLLIACMSIFFDSEKIGKKLAWINGKKVLDSKEVFVRKKKGLLTGFIVVYCALQLFLPFRHYLFADHVDWTGKAQRFSWRMKIMYKTSDIHFYVQEKGKDTKQEVNVGNFLNQKQYTNLVYYPDFIPVVAKHIKVEAEKRGLNDVAVLSTFKIGFMGGEKQLLMDSTLDLSTLTNNPFEDTPWIKTLR